MAVSLSVRSVEPHLFIPITNTDGKHRNFPVELYQQKEAWEGRKEGGRISRTSGDSSAKMALPISASWGVEEGRRDSSAKMVLPISVS